MHLFRRPMVAFLLLLGLWTAYRAVFFVPVWVDELVAKPLLQILPLVFIVRSIERRGWDSLGLASTDFGKHILYGLGIGTVLIVQNGIVHYLQQGGIIVIPEGRDGGGILLALLTSLATGFVEELVFRGYLFTRFEESTRNSMVALIASSFLFVLFHVPLMLFVFHYSLPGMIVYSLTLFILSCVHGCVRWATGSIIPGSIAHGLWNFTNAIIR